MRWPCGFSSTLISLVQACILSLGHHTPIPFLTNYSINKQDCTPLPIYSEHQGTRRSKSKAIAKTLGKVQNKSRNRQRNLEDTVIWARPWTRSASGTQEHLLVQVEKNLCKLSCKIGGNIRPFVTCAYLFILGKAEDLTQKYVLLFSSRWL